MATPDEQYVSIHTLGFWTAFKTQVSAIAADLFANGVTMDPDAWMEFLVNDNPVELSFVGTDTVHAKIGVQADGQPWYDIKIPKEWLA